MNTIEIFESDINLTGASRGEGGSTLMRKNRQAVRSVVFNDLGEVALLFVKKHQYHKLPDGGIEDGEDKIDALLREVREEVGVDITISEEVGTVVEHRDQYGQIQISNAFISTVFGDGSEQSLTELELSQGFELKWVLLAQAINLLNIDKPLNYEGRFIQARDLKLLLWAKEILGV